MINIPSSVAERACKKHYNGVNDWVTNSLRFYIDLLSVQNSGSTAPKITKLTKHYGNINGKTLNALASDILNPLNNCKIDNNNLLSYILRTSSDLEIKNGLTDKALLNVLIYIQSQKDNFIKGDPYSLDKEIINNINFTNLWTQVSKNCEKVIKNIFNYGMFTGENGIKDSCGKFYQAYDLTLAIGTKTCCYCNRLFANTIIKQGLNSNSREKLIRPSLDHFFDQASYPYLALSFYNLIPSCTTCNSKLKHTKPFYLKKNRHPYVCNDIFSLHGKFSYFPQTVEAAYGMSEDIKIDILSLDNEFLTQAKNSKIHESRAIFKYDIIFSEHADIIQELLFKAIKTDRKYLQYLNGIFNLELNEEYLHRLAFGVFPDEKDFHRRPFSVLINDIAKELDLIN